MVLELQFSHFLPLVLVRFCVIASAHLSRNILLKMYRHEGVR